MGSPLQRITELSIELAAYPRNVELWLEKADLFEQLGHHVQALAANTKTLDLQPHHPHQLDIWPQRARLLLALGVVSRRETPAMRRKHRELTIKACCVSAVTHCGLYLGMRTLPEHTGRRVSVHTN